MTPRPPDSTGNFSSAETNPLPHVSSARAWTAIQKPSRPLVTLPKAAPVIREKLTAPESAPRLRRDGRRLRADGTEEICADDIMLIVPSAKTKQKQPSSEEIVETDILVEVTEPKPFRPPAYSVHATQEILAEDVVEVQHVANQLAVKEERPSSVPPPWVVDTADDLEFPTPPKYSGQYPAYASGPRLTNFSATQVFKRRNANLKIVVTSLAAAAAVVAIAGVARLAPELQAGASTNGPVGISTHAPKKLDKSVRTKSLAYGKVAKAQEAEIVSIDALPSIPAFQHRHR